MNDYKNSYGQYPSHLAYVIDKPGLRLPACSDSQLARPANETDYAIMLSPGNYHLICTSVNHIESGLAPLQPGLINGIVPKAMFRLETGPMPPKIPQKF